MAKQQKSQEKVKATTKSQGSNKGNFPAQKTWVTIQGHKRIELELCKGNFPPAQTGEREKDAEKMRAYREAYRADLKQLAKQNANFKPKTLFDLYVAKGGDSKHPMQLAQRIVSALKNNTAKLWGKELPVLSCK